MEAHALKWMEMTKENDLADEFKRFVYTKRYLIVLTLNFSSQTTRKGSRIIVCTEKVEVASLCVRQHTAAEAEHKQLHMDHALSAFYEKVGVIFFCQNILCMVLHYLQVQLMQ